MRFSSCEMEGAGATEIEESVKTNQLFFSKASELRFTCDRGIVARYSIKFVFRIINDTRGRTGVTYLKYKHFSSLPVQMTARLH